MDVKKGRRDTTDGRKPTKERTQGEEERKEYRKEGRERGREETYEVMPSTVLALLFESKVACWNRVFQPEYEVRDPAVSFFSFSLFFLPT